MAGALLLRQSRKYADSGVGLAGSLLKHSLYPLELFLRVLPERGLLLDLGSGDGMLGNLLASRRGGLVVRGVDLDAAKVELARRNAPPNASYQPGDILHQEFHGAVAAIYNDVLHHHPYSHQESLLRAAASFLDTTGILIVKEVDAEDKPDRSWTTFWDRRLYPSDTLHFRNIQGWRKVLCECGFEILETARVRHPWPASRSVLIARKAAPFMPSAMTAGAKTRILITGATGFLARHLARHLVGAGLEGASADVTLLVRDPTRLPADLAASCSIVVGDLQSPALAQCVASQDYVFHLAADKDFFGGKKVFESNVRGTDALLDALRGVTSLRRLVFASSMGAIDRAPADRCVSPLMEESPAHPASMYGRAKYECERRILGAGIPAAVLRLPWCYGPEMSPGTHLRSLSEMTDRGSLVSRFDWPGCVSILEVSECCRAMAFAAVSPATSGRALFVSDPEPISFGELFQAMGKNLGRRAGSRRVPPWIRSLAVALRRFLPFTLRSLFLDTLRVDDRMLREAGFSALNRGEHFLLPMIRSLQESRHPSRWRSEWLVTGAASGIGGALSLQLAARGYSVLMVDRDPAVQDAAARLPGAAAHVADLSRRDDLERVTCLLDSPGVNHVVNCAGVGMRSEVGSADRARLEAMVGVNVEALTRLSEEAVRQFRRAGEGVLVNIASSAGLQPLAGMAAYSASKAYVLAFSEAAAEETRGSGIVVLTVCPSGVATRFQESAGVRRVRGEALLTAEEAAGAILEAAYRRRSGTLFIGRRTLAMALMARLLPRSANARLWRRLMDEWR